MTKSEIRINDEVRMTKKLGIESIAKLFRRIKKSYNTKARPGGLICKYGHYRGCHVLKLQKAAWTNDRMSAAANESGVFFSIWVSGDSPRWGRAMYNIHALKLRELKGYRLTSRAFAAEFRRRFAKVKGVWPNVGMDFGPQTLMAGWIEVGKGFEAKIVGLMRKFDGVSGSIDEMLARRPGE